MRMLSLLLLGVMLSSAAVASNEIDPDSGLVIADNWQLVKAHCGACHSHALVTSQRGDRDYWLKTIRWMQRTQNLWDLPPTIEEKMLDYLAAHYDEREWGRRPPLSPILLPGNNEKENKKD